MATATQEPPTESKQLTAPAPFEMQPITFEATKEALEQMVEETSLLIVESVDDKDGIAAVREKRLGYKKLRVGLKHRHDELKQSSIEYGRQVDSVYNQLVAVIEPEEKRLQHQEDIVKREEARLAKEAEEKRQAVIADRCRQLTELGAMLSPIQVSAMTDEQFAAVKEEKRAAKQERDNAAAMAKAEQDRIAAEQKAEADRLAKDREALDRERAEAETRSKRGVARLEILARQTFAHELTTDELADMENGEWQKLFDTAHGQRAERDRQRKEQEDRAKRMSDRSITLARYGASDDYDIRAIADMSDEDFVGVVSAARDRKEARDKAARDERDRLDRQRQEQEAAQAKIDAEKKRLADEEAARVRAAELEQAKADAAEQARLDAIAEQEKLAAAEKAAAEAAEQERIKREAARPDYEKLMAVAEQIAEIKLPPLSVGSAKVATAIETLLAECAADIREQANQLIGVAAKA